MDLYEQTNQHRLKNFFIGAGFAAFIALASITLLRVTHAETYAVTASTGPVAKASVPVGVASVTDHGYASLRLINSAQADEPAPAASPAPTAEASAVLEPPAWLTGVVQSILGMFPQIGPIVVTVVKWLGFVAVILTIISGAVTTLTSAGAGLFNVVGLTKVADLLKKINDAVQPWIKWLSMFNVQKK